MSVIVTLCLKDGIVMAADSRTTITRTYPNGDKEVFYKDGIKKIFQFSNMGILWSGNARIGKQKVFEYLNDFFNRLPENTSIAQITEMINGECNERLIGDTIHCHIAGYENGEQKLYQIVDGIVTRKNINPETGFPSICIVWDGERTESHRIIYDNETIDIGRPVTEKDIPSFSLKEGVLFAEAMLRKSCEKLDDCGEPIYSLIITENELRWIHQWKA